MSLHPQQASHSSLMFLQGLAPSCPASSNSFKLDAFALQTSVAKPGCYYIIKRYGPYMHFFRDLKCCLDLSSPLLLHAYHKPVYKLLIFQRTKPMVCTCQTVGVGFRALQKPMGCTEGLHLSAFRALKHQANDKLLPDIYTFLGQRATNRNSGLARKYGAPPCKKLVH